MKTFEIKISNTYTITEEDISDILVCAFEGGITYWCDEIEGFDELMKPVDPEPYYSDHYKLHPHGYLKLHDNEDDEWHTMTLSNVLDGIKYTVSQYSEIVNDDHTIDTCNIDATIADVIVQYALFGKVVFG